MLLSQGNLTTVDHSTIYWKKKDPRSELHNNTKKSNKQSPQLVVTYIVVVFLYCVSHVETV